MDTKNLHLKALETLQSYKKPQQTNNSATVTSTSSSNKSNASLFNSVNNSYGSGGSKPVINQQTPSSTKSQTRMLFDVVNYLRDIEGEKVTPQNINANININIIGNQAIIDSLRANPKVICHHDGSYSYKPTYAVKNPREILELLSNNPNGIIVSELAESYGDVEKDVKKLKEQKELFSLKGADIQSDVIFPNDEKYRITLPKELIDMWKDIRVPISETDLEKEMKEAGLTTVEDFEVTKILKTKDKGKKERKRRTTKLTNTHIENFNPNDNPLPK
ncbi:transcription initiation factor IIE2 [Tieghemostelium lacteum]|uniref:Transcription initiation factor IIE subunit beta n=1 Tax=Tieghemostelium lacteum TaxID=361077 RepID=A0A152A0M2_TIELA|nr:transcription initiation factor IIE2 [Tieghemostelium lacteum]|eukprot:KYQ99775.1 transcription initiation factor IIE2 [Tieghemostelium lacteum]